MRFDFEWLSITVGIGVLLLSILFEDYIYPFDIPLIILALIFIAFASYRKKNQK